MSINYHNFLVVLSAAGLVALSSCSDKEEQQDTASSVAPVNYATQIDLLRQELSASSASGAGMVLAEKKIMPGEYLDKLREAIGKGDDELVKILVTAGALRKAKPEDVASILCKAVFSADTTLSIVQILIAGGADINMADSDGMTPLFYAMQARKPNKEVQAMLKSLGAQFGNKLQTAVLCGETTAAEEALKEGCAINDGGESNYTPLCLAMVSPEPGMLAWVLSKGADANAPVGPPKMAPIFMAARVGSEIAVRELAKAGVDINQRNENEDTPLIRACRGGESNYPAIRALVECGADVNAVNKQRRTALYWLAGKVYNMDTVEIARLLVAKGANVNTADEDGETPLTHLCSSLSSVYSEEPTYDKEAAIAMLRLLINSGADVNTEIQSGMMYFTKHGSRKSKLKMTPLIYAQKYRATECIRILKDAGAR